MHKFTRVYAYLRFSSDGQSDGLSFERQRELAYAWTRSQGIPDSAVEFVEDAGFSAFWGAHLSKGALGKLLTRLAETPRDGNELLLFEAVDRSSRQGLFLFSSMIGEFLKTGVFIHFLGEVAPFSKDFPADSILQLKLGIFASLAQQESARKSALSGSNWRNKRKLAYKDGTILTKECPRWLKVVDGHFSVLNDRVASINEVLELAKNGWGVGKIVRYANAKKLPVPGKGGTWHNSLINRLFDNRALLGEYQPHVRVNGKKVAEGEPIPNYYPAVVDPDLFYSVRGIRSTVSEFPNRRDENNYNYLQGLGKCECGGSWRRINKNSGKQLGYAQYSCSNRQRGVTKCKNIPARFFDLYFIAELCSNIPAFLSKVQAAANVKTDSLQAHLKDIEARLGKLIETIENNGDPGGMLTSRMKELLEEKTEVFREIERVSLISAANIESFSEYEAASVYIPAFLTFFESGQDGADNAFKARALFRARLLSAVEVVRMHLDRRQVEVTLKNGSKLPLTLPDIGEIPDAADFGMSSDEDIYPDEVEEDRRAIDELARRFLN
ncbi:recombinase family protein [Burkholderia diffusa]|uniref:recombinase family protein n=1 Tax=Burkholderia diffusa TaxID=488732 RepID=UPI0009BE3919|nr:recombinase family protein [Burkholderia diffusa]